MGLLKITISVKGNGISKTARIETDQAEESTVVDVLHTIFSNEKASVPAVSREVLKIALKADDDQPEHFITGIKYKEGIPHYKCRYWCRNCGHQGTHYIGLTEQSTQCHACNTAHAVRPALDKLDPEGIPERDRFGNFFVAKTLYESGGASK